MNDDKPTTVIIFGASGDLTRRKLIPALLNLYCKGQLPNRFNIVGFARRPWDHAEFRRLAREGVQEYASSVYQPAAWARFAEALWYARGDLDRPDDYRALEGFLAGLEGGDANRLYYLATGPEFFPVTVDALGKIGGECEDCGWRRLVVEKPFGNDLASARALNSAIHAVFDEHQVYRIDHYLGKETAQNILFFRFANTIFEPIWNRRYVDHVQVTVAERVDVGRRAGYYDQAGVLRDMFQNHLLQLLTLVAMEPPASFNADAVRNEKVKVLSAIRPVEMHDTVRAQYRGYTETERVAPGSPTPTYAALRLHIDNWRWRGVPFYLRSGKALATKVSEIVIQFQRPPHMMFNLPKDYRITSNILSLCIQPDEGMHLTFETKVPGSGQEMRSMDMEFHYREGFEGVVLPDAYERLLLDALNGDASLFTRSDEIEHAWALIDTIRAGWESDGAPPLAVYEPGAWGPDEADELLERDGRTWRVTCGDHH
ncbi:MAG: glucose-6-phosphate dehydrogenase [Anaerolineae bacterium]|nr:glucose-6-phosphate dehydrogenase [Anaerolineae bacterium]